MTIRNDLTPTDIKILIVDDDEQNLFFLRLILEEVGYTVISAANGELAYTALGKGGRSPVDLVITDLMMPVVDGLELTRRIRSERRFAHLPIMMLTAGRIDHNDVAKGLELGADDFLRKPINAIEFLARVRSLLRMKKLNDKLVEVNDHLEQLIEERTLEMLSTRDAALFGFARLAEYRDPETGAHLDRIRSYTKILAHWLSENGPYTSIIDDEFVHRIGFSSPLHDIGKVGIPDAILLKPGPLTEGEFETMKTHTLIGGDTLQAAVQRSLTGDEFLAMGRDIAYHHHEKWNGKGYPRGLAGEDIPLAARIMAVADVYDALVSKRVYKDAFSHEKAVAIIIEESGTSFDPAVITAFQALEKGFVDIKRLHAEKESA
jgi:putative two-component system response regulator